MCDPSPFVFRVEASHFPYMVSVQYSSEIDVVWNEAGKAAWDSALSTAPYAAYQQNYDYGEVVAAMGATVHRAQIYWKGELIGVAQMQARRWFGMFTFCLVMRGPVWLSDGVPIQIKATSLSQIAQTIPVKGLHSLFLMPEEEDEDTPIAAGLTRVMSGYHTVLVDLTAPEDALRKRLNGKWRNRLRAAQKEQLTITPMGKNIGKYQWLLEVEEDHQKKAGYRALPTAMVPAYQKALGKGAILAYEAKRGDERVGGMLFLRHGKDATYHIGWASEEGKAINIHNRLLWESMCALKKVGIRSIDLGGANTDYIPGIARFKIGTGGKVLSMSGTWTKGPRWR